MGSSDLHVSDAASLWSKLRKKDASWDRDQLGDVLHWLRQAFALVFGIFFGLMPLTGFLPIVSFLVLSSGAMYAVYAVYLNQNAEDFGGDGTLLQEGLFASVTLFLLSWTLVYSLLHF